MNTNPLVSVIIPVYNTEPYIEAALMSVINQGYTPIEIICCNDGSTDASLAKLHEIAAIHPEVTIINLPENQGIAIARNTAIKRAHGSLIALMDADDIWQPGKLVTQVEFLVNNPTIDITFTHMECFISPELPDSIKQTRYCPPGVTPGYIPGTAVIRSTAFDQVGEFNPEWKVGEFIDWFARAKDLGLAYELLPQAFYLRRIHATNTGVVERPSRTDYLKIIKESLNRRKE